MRSLWDKIFNLDVHLLMSAFGNLETYSVALTFPSIALIRHMDAKLMGTGFFVLQIHWFRSDRSTPFQP